MLIFILNYVFQLLIKNIVLVVAIAAIYFPIRSSFYKTIKSQLFEKAQESNGYLIEKYKFPSGNFGAMVGIYSAIIAGQQLLDFNCTGFRNNFLLILANKQSFKIQFYLYLHSSIKSEIRDCFNKIQNRNDRIKDGDLQKKVRIKIKSDIEKLRTIKNKIKGSLEYEIFDILKENFPEFQEEYLNCIFKDIGIKEHTSFYEKLTLLIQILESYYFFEKSIKQYE
ncbi:MAG: hypothetical protein WC860_07895 [Candidatus Margulisiibacteriota bacterium]|jgi:hypothetical protein